MKYRVVSSPYDKKYSVVHDEPSVVMITDAVCTDEMTAERICDFLNKRASAVALAPMQALSTQDPRHT